MEKAKDRPDVLAAVCGLYCGACSILIGTAEDPARLKRFAERVHLSEEAVRCHGCRSGKRWPYCDSCKMFACAAEKGIDFCSDCGDYPCNELTRFQAEMPHRLDLWVDLDRIRSVGHGRWVEEVKEKYACPQCQVINSAYDLSCRSCGAEPGSEFVAKHKQTIERYLEGANEG